MHGASATDMAQPEIEAAAACANHFPLAPSTMTGSSWSLDSLCCVLALVRQQAVLRNARSCMLLGAAHHLGLGFLLHAGSCVPPPSCQPAWCTTLHQAARAAHARAAGCVAPPAGWLLRGAVRARWRLRSPTQSRVGSLTVLTCLVCLVISGHSSGPQHSLHLL